MRQCETGQDFGSNSLIHVFSPPPKAKSWYMTPCVKSPLSPFYRFIPFFRVRESSSESIRMMSTFYFFFFPYFHRCRVVVRTTLKITLAAEPNGATSMSMETDLVGFQAMQDSDYDYKVIFGRRWAPPILLTCVYTSNLRGYIFWDLAWLDDGDIVPRI